MPKMLINGVEHSFNLILFDLDGTLVNDRERYRSLASIRFTAIHVKAGRHAAELWAPLGGYDYLSDNIDMNGPIAKASRREDMALAAAAIYLTGKSWHEARVIAEAAYTEADEIQLKNYTPQLIDGVKEKLEQLKENGFTLGLATNGPSQVTMELLETLGVRELFSVVVGSEGALNPKPAPDLLLDAFRKVGVDPSATVYIGDQEVDVIAANAAGCKEIFIIGETEIKTDYIFNRLKSLDDLRVLP